MNLAGRDRELRILREALHHCLDGRRGGGVIVSGPVGVGRTALLLQLGREAAAAGAAVLHATCSALEREFPLSAVHQLVATPGPDDADAEQAAQLLAEGALVAGTCSGRLTVPVVQGLCDHLVRRAARQPLVLLVDDAQDIDPQSLEVLLFTVRRIRAVPVFLVLTERDAAIPDPVRDPLLADLARQDHFRRLALRPLAQQAVSQLVAARAGNAGTAAARRLAADWHAVSGGNAVLLKALLDDRCRQAAEWTGCTETGFTLGESFRRALITCLYRLEPRVLATVQALAVLGEPGSPALVADLAGLDPDVVGRSVAALDAAGLLDRGWFRHPDARAEVLRTLDDTASAALHRRAAFLLHGSDTETVRVARHLAAAGDVREPWAAPILQSAAQQALDAGRADSAVQWLRLAERAGADERQRAAAKAALIQVEARLDPANISRHLPWVVDTLHHDRLSGSLGLAAVKYAFWHGRPREAADALIRMRDGGTPVPHRMTAWLTVWYPGLCDDLGLGADAGAAAAAVEDSDRGDADRTDPDGGEHGLEVLADFLGGWRGRGARRGRSGRNVRDAVERAERVLRSHRARRAQGTDDEDAIESLVSALTVLLYADRADRAALWCEPLQDSTTAECGPLWRALLTSVQAQAALRLGDPAGAALAAQSALSQIGIEGWGVASGIPLTTLTLARTALGRSEHAARHLAVPTLPAMVRTPAGAQLRYARGVHELAEGRPEAALGHLHACGEYLIRHRIDLPGIAPWRLTAAEAYLALGRRFEARSLLEDQLAASAEGSRTQGIALRMLAGLSGPAERLTTLAKAVAVLDACGAQADLADALADLATVYHEQGDSGIAREFERRAVYLRAARGSVVLPSVAEQAVASVPARVPAAGALRASASVKAVEADAGPDLGELTDSERRVAMLATQGFTNREISRRLYITVSTVEQHLTRTYRKLGVAGRADLVARLGGARASSGAGPGAAAAKTSAGKTPVTGKAAATAA